MVPAGVRLCRDTASGEPLGAPGSEETRPPSGWESRPSSECFHHRAGRTKGFSISIGDDADGVPLEVMAVELSGDDLYVIHAMPLREKYRLQYEEAKKWQI